MMKNMKMKTKLILGFSIPIIITIINIVISDVTTKWAASIADEASKERFITISSFATMGFAALSVLLTVWIASLLIKVIEKSVKQLSDAAKDIAMGRVDIEMVKYNNDEFGDLVDEYTEVIENIKYQAKIAEEVSHGNLTITVNPKSPEDLLGNSLKQLVEDNFHILSNIKEVGNQVTTNSSQAQASLWHRGLPSRRVLSNRLQHQLMKLQKRQSRMQMKQIRRQSLYHRLSRM